MRLPNISIPCLSGVLLAGTFQGCAVKPVNPASQTRDRAYITYTPAPKDGSRLRLAVKDIIDLKGQVTSAGSEYLFKNSPPAKRDAQLMAGARNSNVVIVGKTNVTEFAVGTSGVNDYFGTPRNFLGGKKRLIPGGSSNGSAVAVANGSADVAFGSDTAGSIRTPAACCGIYGLKTTFGLVSLKGVFPLSPKNLDTIGPMAGDLPHLVKGMDLLKPGFNGKYQKEVASHSSGRSIRIGRLYLPGTDPAIDAAVDDALRKANFKIIRLDERFVTKWNEAKKHARTVALADSWVNHRQFLDKRGVSAPTKATILLGELEYSTSYSEALKARKDWQRELRRVFRKVDFIALPTLNSTPPRVPLFARMALFEAQIYDLQNTAAVNYAGNPALAVPIPLQDRPISTTSLQLVGPRLSEAGLINAARLIKAKK